MTKCGGGGVIGVVRPPIEIDGSFGSGGGAILRVAASLSAVTSKPVHIFNIRKGRPKGGGLKTQHLEGLKTLAELCDGKLEGGKLYSTNIKFCPGKIKSKKLSAEISTAGSIGLLFQVLKLPASQAEREISVKIKGGATFGKFAPPVPYVQNVLLPVLGKMGYRAEIEILKHGFYPKGGGLVNIAVQPCKTFEPLNLTERGEVEKIEGLSIASKHLEKRGVATRQANEAKKIILEKIKTAAEIKTQYVDADCPGSGIVLWAKTSTGCILGSDGLGELGKTSEQVGMEAAKSLLKTINSGATVDSNLSDQVLIFMALARGKSEIIAPELTAHAKTNIWVIRKFLKTKFEVKENKNVRIVSFPTEPGFPA